MNSNSPHYLLRTNSGGVFTVSNIYFSKMRKIFVNKSYFKSIIFANFTHLKFQKSNILKISLQIFCKVLYFLKAELLFFYYHHHIKIKNNQKLMLRASTLWNLAQWLRSQLSCDKQDCIETHMYSKTLIINILSYRAIGTKQWGFVRN